MSEQTLEGEFFDAAKKGDVAALTGRRKARSRRRRAATARGRGRSEHPRQRARQRRDRLGRILPTAGDREDPQGV